MTDQVTCKYRDCGKPATIGQFCSASHKAGFYRDRRATHGKGSATNDQNATNQGATSGDGATSSAANSQPLDSREVQGHVLTRMDLRHWRGTRPAYLDKPTGLDHLTDWQLHSRLMDLNPWQGTPEYAERVYRLVHGLTEFLLPNNMAVA